MSSYSKNLILCGEVDYHCLLCQETFRTIADVEKHIRWEKHRKVIKIQAYLPKFKNDKIYKVNTDYFCEICNIVFQNIKSVKDHIKDETHNANKNNPESSKRLVGKYEFTSVVIQEKIISNDQWNGIVGKNCILCDTLLENIVEHKGSLSHIMNLIRTITKCEDDKVYRQINDTLFQCFTCNNAFSFDTFNEHWTSEDHIKNIPKPKHEKHNYNSKEDSEHFYTHMSDYYATDLKSKRAICKECNMSLECDFIGLYKHYQAHRDKDIVKCKIVDHGKYRSELKAYGKDNHIKLNSGGSKGLCMLCNKYLSPHMNNFKEHVTGSHHSDYIDLKKGIKKCTMYNSCPYETTSVENYLKEVQFSSDTCSLWIDNFSIDILSFLLIHISKNGPQYKKIRCYICYDTFSPDNVLEHCESVQHIDNFVKTQVVLVDGHFIRVLCPNLFHCGICNAVFPYWDRCQLHFKTYKHMISLYNKILLNSINKFISKHGKTPKAVDISNYEIKIIYKNLMNLLNKDNTVNS